MLMVQNSGIDLFIQGGFALVARTVIEFTQQQNCQE